MPEKHKTNYSYQDAEDVAQNTYAAFVALYRGATPETKTIQSFVNEVDRLLSETNISQFPYPNSLLWKARVFASDDLVQRQQATAYVEDIHYMGEKDTLAVLAQEYYGNPSFMIEIMSRNKIYSTDEALKKGILKVLSKNGN